MTDLDPFEIKILRELQRDANQTTAEIAERVGLSVSPCWRRIDRLEREGFIKKRVAIIDRGRLLALDTPAGLIRQHRDDPRVRQAAHGEITLEDVFIGLTGGAIRD